MSVECWPPPPRSFKLIIAVPSSFLSTENDPRHKAIKAGYLGRILAVYRVDEIAVYDDRPTYWRDGDMLAKLLEYMVVAPYLRRRVFPPNVPELRYAGVLPPLQLPTHGVGGPSEGEVREALVLGVHGRRVLLDAGLKRPVSATLPEGLEVRRGERVLVRIVRLSGKNIEVEIVDGSNVYSGYRVRRFTSLMRVLRSYSSCVKVATSRRGRVVDLEYFKALTARARERGCMAILFGAPDMGLYEIADLEGFKLEENVDDVINVVPCQGTRTVRTEEAVAATLALLNVASETEA